MGKLVPYVYSVYRSYISQVKLHYEEGILVVHSGNFISSWDVMLTGPLNSAGVFFTLIYVLPRIMLVFHQSVFYILKCKNAVLSWKKNLSFTVSRVGAVHLDLWHKEVQRFIRMDMLSHSKLSPSLNTRVVLFNVEG